MFAIQCTTCGAKLGVNDENLIGQILACPKCGGMVLVEKPGSPTQEPAAKPAEEESAEKAPRSEIQPEIPTSVPIEQHAAPPPPPAVLDDSEVRKRKILLGVLCGLVGVLVLALGILLTMKGETPEQPPKPPEIAAQPHEPPAPIEPPRPVEHAEPIPPVEILLPPPPPLPPKRIETASPKDPKDGSAGDVPILNLATRAEVTVTEDAAEKERKRVELAELLAGTSAPDPKVESKDDATQDAGTTVRSAADWLSDLESRMPGLLDPAAVLPVDVPTRLDMPVAELRLDETSLLNFIRTISEWIDVPFSFEIDEFRCRGLRLDMPLTGRFDNETLAGILAKQLAPLDLEPVIEDRQVRIAVPVDLRDKIVEKEISVTDLISGTANSADLQGRPDPDGPLTAPRLAEILRRLVDPAGFQRIGRQLDSAPDGQPDLRIENDVLVLRHRLRRLDQSFRLLEQLRVLRKIPQTTAIKGEELAPEVFGWDGVSAPMTLNYYQPTPLDGVIRQLEAATKMTILVDHRALHRALTPLSSIKATVRCDRKTVNEALESLLDSVDTVPLTYRIIDAKTLEITTYDAARTQDAMSIEVHFYETPDHPLQPGETPEELVQTLKLAVEPDSWYSPNRPDSLGFGDIVIDRPSGCLLVRQSQPVQRSIRLWLEAKMKGTKTEE